MDEARSHVEDLRGATRLAVEATRGVTDVVEAMHRAALIGNPFGAVAKALSGPVYASVRGVAGLVGGAIDLALAQLQPLLGGSAPGREREAVRAALNGVLGDYLEATANPLAIPMRLRGAPGARVVVLVHGSAMSDLAWARGGHDHGAALANDLGYAPLYLHYNSGLHISTNGRTLAALLEALPPMEEIAIVGHSMGGLVARSACHAAAVSGHVWLSRLRTLVCLGSPHHGAGLERGGSFIHAALGATPWTAPLARLARIRSAGVTDLRYGNVRDEDWQGRDRFSLQIDRRTPLPLPAGVRCFAAAASASASAVQLSPGDVRSPQFGGLPGDGLVSVESALGRHADATRTLAFQQAWVGFGMKHLDLLGRPDAYEVLRTWLR